MMPDSDPHLPVASPVDPTAPTVPAPPPAPVSRSKAPPGTAPPRTPSGKHPAVRAYRGKLASIHDGQGAALDNLTARIEKETETISKTPIPPPLEDGENELTPVPTSH